jgi:hypothetical protein
MEAVKERRRNYPLRGLWQAASRRLHANSQVSIYIHDEQGKQGVVAHDEKELRQIWDMLVLPAAEARRDVWITETGDLMVS